jgi:hypothetical protein
MRGLCELRVRKIDAVIALALAVAVVFILVTPDPTDDVAAILHLVKGARSHPICDVSTLNSALIMRVSCRLYVSSASNVMSHVPELLCAYRC